MVVVDYICNVTNFTNATFTGMGDAYFVIITTSVQWWGVDHGAMEHGQNRVGVVASIYILY